MLKKLHFKSLLLIAVMLLGGASTVWGQTKITDYNNIVSGKKYYIGATTGGTDYYLYVDGSSTAASIAGTAKSDKAEATPFIFEGSGTTWTIKFENGNYLSLKNGKDNGKVVVQTASSNFTASNQSGKLRLTIGSYSIQKNNTGTQFGSYANTQTDIWLELIPDPVAVTGVSLNKTETSIEAGNTETLIATVAPDDATNKNVTWTSDAPTVATVSTEGVVSGVALGTATITATTEDGGKTAKCTVTVTAPVTPSITLSTKDVDVNAEEHDGTITVGYYNFSVSAVDIAYFEADGTTSAKASDYDWLVASINDVSNNVEYVIDANTSKSARSAYFKVYALDDEANEVYSDLITITQAGLDFVTLPFSWAGGTKTNLTNIAGVRGTGLGSDYGDTNAPYYVKLDDTGDYIQIKTNAQPGKVTIGVKMIGGASTSSITVKASADGESYRDIQTLSISGAQNTVLTLATTKAFAPTDCYIRLVFTKGSNVGVGPITIVGCAPVTVSAAGFATFCTANALDFSDAIEGVTAYTASLEGDVVSFNEISTDIPANTGILLKAEAGTYYLPFAISSSTDVSGNKLVGVTEETVIGKSSDKGTHYVLKKIAGVGFYKVNNDDYKVRANSAYLALTVSTGGTGAKDFIPVDGTTAIELVDTANEVAAPVYNLQGQRVSEGYKGVVIVNGKKIMMK